MAFNGDFSITSLITPGSFTINDTSTGTDANLTGRTIYLYLSDGSLLTGGTINWPLSAGSSKIISTALTRDYSISIVVTWQSSAALPSPSTYTQNALATFIGFSRQFEDMLIGSVASNPDRYEQDQNFMENLGKLQTWIDCAIQAGDTGEQGSAQNSLDKIYSMMQNQNFLF